MSELYKIRVGDMWLKADESIDQGYYNFRFTSRQDRATPFFRLDQVQEIRKDLLACEIHKTIM